jgi:hypothetical protein
MQNIWSGLRKQAIGITLGMVALFVALGGTSGALNGPRNASAKAAQAKGKVVRGPRGRTGPRGPAGAKGMPGAPGTPGRSALTALGSGETERGVIGFDGDAPAATGDFRATMAYPIPLAAAPAQTFIVGETTGSNVCTGTTTAPSAPSGTLCVYPYSGNNPTISPGNHQLLTLGAPTLGFRIGWSVGATGDTYFYGSYAVTG